MPAKASGYSIVYEDDWLIVVDKPSGMLVISTVKNEAHTLTHLLNKELDGRGIAANAYPCHRLDRDTSGLVIYAKGKKAQKLMMDEFKKRAVKKLYTAIVNGTVKKDSGEITGSIYNRNRDRYEEAVTEYRVLKRGGGFSVLEVQPVTGRTNQIRIHMKGSGHPILGERVYAFRRDSDFRFKRLALHARYLGFRHPATGKDMSFVSDLRKDMAEFIG